MKDGVIADFEITEAMLRAFYSESASSKVDRARVVVAVLRE